MKNPFIFGKAAENEYFTDRQEDVKRLETNLTHGINTILISPRRWGKTSLVKKVMKQASRDEHKFIYIDVFQCKSEYDFLHVLVNGLMKQTATRTDELIEFAKTFLTGIVTNLSYGIDPASELSLSFEWNPKNNDENKILNLPEKISTKINKKLIVCIDEFQQISNFHDNESFQKKLRSIWQHQQNTTYCLFGSKKHLMENMFSDKRMPFYKFGDLMFLKKITTEHWISYICERFERTGKNISAEHARKICELAENLSSYVQQLSWIVWYKADKTVTDSVIEDAVNDLIEQNRIFFQREVEQMTVLQLNFMKALADGVNDGFTTKTTMKKYKLESSANVATIKKSLLNKDLIYMEDNQIVFDDPMMKLWLKSNKD